jgi:hypothetical protein
MVGHARIAHQEVILGENEPEMISGLSFFLPYQTIRSPRNRLLLQVDRMVLSELAASEHWLPKLAVSRFILSLAGIRIVWLILVALIA